MARPRTTPDMRTVGSTGLPVYAGRVYDEELRELQGEKGRQILREMSEQDPIIGGTFLGIEMLSRQVSWTLKPADETEEAKKISDFYDECMSDLNPGWGNTLSEILSMLTYGWSYLEMVYKKREGYKPKSRLRTSRFDDGKVGWASWAIRSQETLYQWKYENEDGTGELLGMEQWVPWASGERRQVLIPREKSLHFTTRSRRENPEGISILRNAYRSWYMKKNIEVIEGIGVERDLAGLPVIWAPERLFAQDASDEDKELFEMLKTMVTSIKHDEQEGILMPMAYDEENNPLFKIELLSTGGDRQFDTNGIINRYDERIAMSMLADFILMGHQAVGSFALSSTKTNLFSTALSAFLDIIAAEVNAQAFPQLAVVNGIALDKIPTLMHGKIESADLAKLGEFLKQLYAAGMTLFPNSDLEAYVMDVAGLPGGDSGAGVWPMTTDEAGNLIDQQGNVVDPATGKPTGAPPAPAPQPEIDPATGKPVVTAAKPPASPGPQRKKAATTPVSAARPRAAIAATERSRHFVPLSVRASKLHEQLSSQLSPEAYGEFVLAVFHAGSFTKLSPAHQQLITAAESAG